MHWSYQTRAGTFRIVFRDRRYLAMFDDEALGSYATPGQGADDLAGGHTFTPSNGINTASLGIPDNIHEWEYHGK